MNVLLIDNGTTLLNKLEALIPGEEIVQTWREVKPEQFATADLVILSGGSRLPVIGNEAAFKAELELVRTDQKPLIGICLGCELVAVGWGGTLRQMADQDKGIRKITAVRPGFFADANEFSVYENHRWAIEQMPEEFEVLAESEPGPEMIRHRTLPIYGLQFHPENFVAQSDGDEIFLRLISSLNN